MTMERLGKRVKELRDRRGLAQERLANAAEISTRSLSRLESGASVDIKLSTIEKIAEALGVALVFELVDPARAEPSRTREASAVGELELRPVVRQAADHVEYEAPVAELAAYVRRRAAERGQAGLADAALKRLGRTRRLDNSRSFTQAEVDGALDAAAKSKGKGA